MNKLNVYLSAPINGIVYQSVLKYFTNTKSYLEQKGFNVLNPMAGKYDLQNTDQNKLPVTNATMDKNKNINSLYDPHSVFLRDFWMVKQADIIFCNLAAFGFDFDNKKNNPSPISIGCLMEVAWGYAFQKNIVTVIDDNNPLHNHIFIKQASTTIFTDYSKALDAIIALA